MKLMLLFLLGAVILGLATDTLDRRTYAALIAGVIGTTGLYFVFERFMA
jgi:hypothetical protein